MKERPSTGWGKWRAARQAEAEALVNQPIAQKAWDAIINEKLAERKCGHLECRTQMPGESEFPMLGRFFEKKSPLIGKHLACIYNKAGEDLLSGRSPADITLLLPRDIPLESTRIKTGVTDMIMLGVEDLKTALGITNECKIAAEKAIKAAAKLRI